MPQFIRLAWSTKKKEFHGTSIYPPLLSRRNILLSSEIVKGIRSKYLSKWKRQSFSARPRFIGDNSWCASCGKALARFWHTCHSRRKGKKRSRDREKLRCMGRLVVECGSASRLGRSRIAVVGRKDELRRGVRGCIRRADDGYGAAGTEGTKKHAKRAQKGKRDGRFLDRRE